MSAVTAPAKPEAKQEPSSEKKASEQLAKAAKKPTGKRAPKANASSAPVMPNPKDLAKEREEAEARKKARGSSETAAKRADDPLVRLSWKATALCTGGDASSAATAKGGIKFGAPFNTTQIRELQGFVKGRDILKDLGGVSLAKLKAFAKGEIQRTDLPEDTRKALAEITGKFDPKRKMWPRKTAGGLVVILEDRKARAK